MRVNERGNIEIVSKPRVHRRVAPMKGVTYESLFGRRGPEIAAESLGWSDDIFVGAEREAWPDDSKA